MLGNSLLFPPPHSGVADGSILAEGSALLKDPEKVRVAVTHRRCQGSSQLNVPGATRTVTIE